MLKVTAPKRPKYQPRPVEVAHLRAVLGLNLWPSTRLKIMLAAYAGLRVHEIAKIRGEDYDTIANKLTVEGKGGRVDTLPLHSKLAGMAKSQPRQGWWFPSFVHPGHHQHSRSVGDGITSAFSRIGVKITAHQLRHYFATSLLKAGAKVRVVQTLMRHESLSTTALYMRVDVDQQRQALTQLTIITGGAEATVKESKVKENN